MPRISERVLQKALRIAFEKGRRAGERTQRAEFDALLARMTRLKELNGTTDLFVKAWDESQHRRDHGKFSSTGGASGDAGKSGAAQGMNKEQSGDEQGRAVHPADAKAKSLLQHLKDVPRAVRERVASFVQAKYAGLVERYGETGAKAVLGATVLLLPVPVPGTSLLPVAIAEAVLKIRNAVRGAGGPEMKAHQPELSDEELQAAAQEFLAGLYAEMGEELPKQKYASTQVELTGAAANKLLALGERISDEDLADDGREDKPHVTVRYGFHDDDPEPVAAIVSEFDPVTLRLGGLNVFRGDEHDVIYAEVDSPDLHNLNEALAALPHTDTHPEYHPHATVAYVKPGLADKYLASLGAVDEDATADSVTFSTAGRDKTIIPLRGRGELDHEEHSDAFALAMLEHAVDARERGDDPRHGLESIRAAFEEHDGGAGDGVIRKAWNENVHPRDDSGRFVSKDAIQAAKSDPGKAAALRERVTDPAQRKKLDAALGGETDVGRTKRGQAKHEAGQRREAKAATRARANELIAKLSDYHAKPGTVRLTAEDLHALADHLADLPLDDLKRARMALRANLEGDRRKADVVRRLTEHARGMGRELAPKKKRDRSGPLTLHSVVKEYGGIDPDSHALKSVFSGISEAREYGISLGVFKKGGEGLDVLARQVANAGHMIVPENRDPGEYLLEQLAKGTYSAHADLEKQHERALDDYYKAQHEAEQYAERAEIERAVRSGEAEGRTRGAHAPDEGAGGRPESDDSDLGTVDDSFDFGANVAEPQSAAASPRDTRTLSQRLDEDLTDADKHALELANRLEGASEPAREPNPDFADAENYDRAREKLDRMGQWEGQRPASVAAEEAASRARSQLGRATATPGASPPTPVVAGRVERGPESDATFAQKVQAAADAHTHGFGGNKVYIGDVFDTLHADDPTLTREEFNTRLQRANAAGHLTLSRADLTQLMDPEAVKRSETETHPGTGTAAHFVLAAEKKRQQRSPAAAGNRAAAETGLHGPDADPYTVRTQPHRATRRDYIARGEGYDPDNPIQAETAGARHRVGVEAALAAGKPVPDAVLRDYPDLAAKQKPAETPAAQPSPEHATLAAELATAMGGRQAFIPAAIQKLEAKYGRSALAAAWDAAQGPGGHRYPAGVSDSRTMAAWGRGDFVARRKEAVEKLGALAAGSQPGAATPKPAPAAAQTTAPKSAPKPGPKPATPDELTRHEAAIQSVIDRDKREPTKVTPAEVDAALEPLKNLPKEQLYALAKKLTGLGGRSAADSLRLLRNDMTAVARLLESQKV